MGDTYYSDLTYTLCVDIDMTVTNWTPFDRALKGRFDGGGHTIRINISGATANYQGLFKEIHSNGTVENLHVEGNIHCSDSRLVGGICGENNGTIRNCWVSADVRSDWTGSGYAKVGGIAGQNDGVIEYCCMSGNVTNNDADVGGIVGDNDGDIIRHCVFYGTRSSTHDQDNIYAGDSGTEEDCFDFFNQTQYDAASDYDMFRNAIKYPYTINVNNVGTGAFQASAGGETDIPGWRHGETITLTNTTGRTLHSLDVKDADGNNISCSGSSTTALTFTMPRKAVNVNAVFTADLPAEQGTDYAGPESGEKIVGGGGCYGSEPYTCTSAYHGREKEHNGRDATLGFRIVLR